MKSTPNLRTQLVVLAAAWLNAIPAFYLFYDYWMRGLDSSVTRRELLRPYAFFVGACPLVLFWLGSIFAASSAARSLSRTARGPATAGRRALSWFVFALGALGGLLGTVVGVPLLAVMLLAMGRGDVPLGLLGLLAGLSAAGIWLGRYILRRFDRASP